MTFERGDAELIPMENLRANVLGLFDERDAARARAARLAEALSHWAREYVFNASQRLYDGTQGDGIRAEARRRLAVIDSALATTDDDAWLTAQLAAARADERAKAIEECARIAEVGGANQEQWDWSKLPAVLRALATPAAKETT